MKNNPVVPFSEALAVWVRIGLLSFGGPAGQIALMHRILVEEKRWIGEKRFLHALNYCMLLPGPEAQQLAVYIGWLLHRTIGGLTAGLLFILPGLAVVLTLSTVYALFHKTHILMMIFYGLKPAVVAMVALALWRLSRRALHTSFHLILAILAFIALFVFAVPFPFVILGAGTVGLIATRLRPEYFSPVAHPVLSSSTAKIEPLLSDAPMDPVSWHATGKVAIVCFVLWLGPVFGAGAWLGWHSTLAEVGIFFSKMALVTFGGAYAVLSYVAQQAVSHYGWLGTDEMVDGLALAETTPGPLILVLSFVAFLAGYRHGDASSLWMGLTTALFATWVTFVPCFLFIFAGAPYIERLRNNPIAASVLSTITAAVVGVVLNLGLWFAFTVFFHAVTQTSLFGIMLRLPVWHSPDPLALILFAIALGTLLWLRWGIVTTLCLCAAVGALIKFALS